MASDEREQTQILKEILKWTKFAGMRQVQSVLENALPTSETRLAYQLSDGTRGSVEIGKTSGAGSKDKVVGLWGDWFRLGLGDLVPVKGGERFKRAFDLKDFGIDFPKLQELPPMQMSHTSADPGKSKAIEDELSNA